MKLRKFIAGLFAICLLFGSAAQAVEPWGQGIGIERCSYWTKQRDFEAIPYIFGFWSALNYVALVIGRNNGHIGELTGPLALAEEVRQACQADPTAVLNRAILSVYDKVRIREAAQAK